MMTNTAINKQQQGLQQQQRSQTSQNQHAILMSDLKNDGQVESKLLKSINNIGVGICDGRHKNKRDEFLNQTEANTFKIYQLSLKLDPFNKATCLLALSSIGILSISTIFFFLDSLISQQQQPKHQFNQLEDSSWPPSQTLSYIIQLIANFIQLSLIVYVILGLKKRKQQSSLLQSSSSLKSYVDEKNSSHRDVDNRKNYLKKLQIILLTSSSCLIVVLSISSYQLIAIQPITIFIIYTLLAIDNQSAFLATFAANIIHLASLPITIKSEQRKHQPYLINRVNLWPLILTIVVYIFFHAIGLYLNKKSHDNCKESFKAIKSYVSAKIMMDIEDKRLTKLMESVIPKHLAGKMRDDILSPQSKGIFEKIYLESFDNVSILFADIVNFTKISSNCSAQSLVETLNELFGRFDKAADKNHCLRIKILGDCYYCVSGIPEIGREHAIDSVEMGLDMIDILGELAQDNSGGLNMRVGIHSGRVLCGVLGKKKWQFDVHSNDVKLANHTEQSGIPGRVHITQDTLKALGDRYKVEDAYGHLRDTYIAHSNISTYFVISPSDRRPSIASFKSFPAAIESAIATASNSHKYATQMSNSIGLSTQLDQDQQQQHKSNVEQPREFPLPATITISKSSFTTSQQQILQPKLRFKTATQRLINALHFIRTIDAPFANLDAPTSSSTTNIDRIMHDTIVSRSLIHHQDIHRFTLKFKDEYLGQLYGHPSMVQMLTKLLIFISSLILLLALVIQTTLDWNLQTIEFQIGPKSTTSNHDATWNGNVNANNSMVDSFASNNDSNAIISHADKIQSTKSYVMMGEMLIVFLITILVYMHQNEHNARTDFLWRQIAIQDKDRMALMRDCNKNIFFNLLPPHVASYFLEQRVARSNMDQDLYHKSYDRIGVVFATISNFSEFYSEVEVNNHGMECLRLLNEIICDFDSILDQERFRAVDKIKTIGTTYMAAIGLFPDYELPSASIEPILEAVSDKTINNKSSEVHENISSTINHTKNNNDKLDLEARRKVAKYLQILVNFVIEMREKLHAINEESFNSFQLRVGINLGPVTAGVIGASKPQYDIWGNTVNVASRMETTAEPNKIQITEEVFRILNEFNVNQEFKFTCRGSINVKGKGSMTTYYLDY